CTPCRDGRAEIIGLCEEARLDFGGLEHAIAVRGETTLDVSELAPKMLRAPLPFGLVPREEFMAERRPHRGATDDDAAPSFGVLLNARDGPLKGSVHLLGGAPEGDPPEDGRQVNDQDSENLGHDAQPSADCFSECRKVSCPRELMALARV